jgi:hypothetical protein
MVFIKLIFAFMFLLLEFTGLYRQTKSGDKKYQGGDGKLEKGSTPMSHRVSLTARRSADF